MLKLEDIFTKNVSIKNLLAQAYYKSLAFEYGLNTDTGVGDLDEIDYGKIENDVFKYIAKFNEQGEEDFYFLHNSVVVVVDGIHCGIELQEYFEYVTIYNLVNEEESLYENGNLEKNNYVFGPNYFANMECFEKVGENNFLSIYNYYKQDGKLENYSQDDYSFEYTKKLVDNIENIKKTIEEDYKKENGKAYIYNINSYGTDYETGLEVFTGQKVEVDLKNFEENIDEIFAMGARQPTGGDFILSLFEITQDFKYEGNKVFEIMIKDNNGDGKLDLGQKLVTSGEDYWEMDYEF